MATRSKRTAFFCWLRSPSQWSRLPSCNWSSVGCWCFTPGTRYEYCTLSFYILGELITRLSGMPYPEYLRKHIFEPLGMQDTSFDPGVSKPDRAVPIPGDTETDYFKTTL